MATRPWRARLAYSVLGAMLLALASGLPAGAVPADGLIVFESDRGGQLDLWTMRPDGSDAAKLTNDKVEDAFPEWSPNGKRIAWTRGGFGTSGELWVMNADGTGRRQITFNAFSDIDPVWSPDSSQLAFRSIRGGNRDIYVIGADGTGERRLTSDPAIDYAPDWSPDGARIAFTSERSGASAVYTMSAIDGSDVRKLTPDSLQAAIPRYSPDGRQIAFVDERCFSCVQSDVWVMNTDGSGLRRVTNTPENETTEAWSHDGTRVVVDFAKLTAGGADLGKSDVAVVTMATGAVVNLTNTGGSNESHADWQP
jgi:Tol biopolymer transport system component